jgi:hypothetical protein
MGNKDFGTHAYDFRQSRAAGNQRIPALAYLLAVRSQQPENSNMTLLQFAYGMIALSYLLAVVALWAGH